MHICWPELDSTDDYQSNEGRKTASCLSLHKIGEIGAHINGAAMDSTGGQTTCRWPCPPRKSTRKEKCIHAGEDTRLSGIGLVHTRGAEKRDRLFFPFGPQPQATLGKMDRIRFSLASTAGQHLEQGAQSERNDVSGK